MKYKGPCSLSIHCYSEESAQVEFRCPKSHLVIAKIDLPFSEFVKALLLRRSDVQGSVEMYDNDDKIGKERTFKEFDIEVTERQLETEADYTKIPAVAVLAEQGWFVHHLDDFKNYRRHIRPGIYRVGFVRYD